jgi:peptidyl-prolyl cis-trans isomerase SurA
MKRAFLYSMSALTTILLITGTWASAEIYNKIVAVVNDEVITLHELDAKIEEVSQSAASELEKKDPDQFQKVRQQVLNLLIDEKVAIGKAKELKLDATPKEVDDALELIKSRNQWTQEDLFAALDQKGLNIETYREKIKNELEQSRLIDFEIKSKIIVSDEAIKKYYEEHSDQFKADEKVRLAIIFLTQDNPSASDSLDSLQKKAEEIERRLNKGEPFAELARQFSQGPGAQEGGDLGFILTSQLDPKLKAFVDQMSEGETSKPIISASGIQFVKLVEKRPQGVQSLEDSREAIHEILYKQEIGEIYSSWINELRKKAYIKINI